MASLTLYPHQREAIDWMKRIETGKLETGTRGGFLLDEMGLGKTITALSLVKENMPDHYTFIVAPLSVTRQWLEQIKLFFPEMYPKTQLVPKRATKNTVLFDFTKRVFILSYSQIQSKYRDLARFLNSNDKETLVQRFILDEGHMLRNTRTRRFFKLTLLREYALRPYTWILTATPFNNRVSDLQALDKLTAEEYDENYWKKLRRNPPSMMREMRKWIQKRSMRRKIDILGDKLPQLIVNRYFYTRHNPKYEELFEKIYQEWIAARPGNEEYVIAQIQLMRKVLADSDGPRTEIAKEKIDAILQSQDEYKGDKIIVFSFFKGMIQQLHKEHYKSQSLYIDGEIVSEARFKMLQTFKTDPTKRILFMTTMTGGIGLNITQANHILLLEPYYNPFYEKQIFGRIYRIGQEKRCVVSVLYMKRTLEEWMYLLEYRKRVVGEYIVDLADVSNHGFVPGEGEQSALLHFMLNKANQANPTRIKEAGSVLRGLGITDTHENSSFVLSESKNVTSHVWLE